MSRLFIYFLVSAALWGDEIPQFTACFVRKDFLFLHHYDNFISYSTGGDPACYNTHMNFYV